MLFESETKAGKYVVFWYFNVDIRSATLFERSRRKLSNDVAEHKSILKNYQNAH